MRFSPQNAGASRARSLKLAAVWMAIIAVLAGFGAAAMTMLLQPPDVVDLCASGSEITTSTLVIVDTSDPLSEIQQRRLRATVNFERDRLPRGGKFTLLGLNAANPAEPIEWVSACNPGRASEANPLFVTVSEVDKHWAESFGAPIETALASAGNAPPAETSPIIETVSAALSRPDLDARVQKRRLVLVSDMLENGKGGYSQLAGGDFWKPYEKSLLASQVALDLHGVSVSIDYLLRPKYAAVQGEKHRGFWRRLFSDAGAESVTFVGLSASEGSPSANVSPNKVQEGG